MKNIFKNSGQTLVELLITIGLAAILLPALLGAFSITRSGRAQMDQRIKAIAFLQEGEESLRVIRANDWTNLADGTFHPVATATTWTLAPNAENLGDFTRQIVISDIYRDANGNIATTGGVLDPSTKQVTVTVSWNNPLTGSVTDVSYLTRHKNIAEVQTTVTDFSTGTFVNTAAVSTVGSSLPNDGQVQLGAGGGANGGDWCKPSQYILKTYDLPGQGVAQNLSATSTATQNVAYTTTGGNASGDAVDGLTVSFANPPAVNPSASNNEAKAYGIFVDAGGNYVYFNENNPPNHLVQIVNASNLIDVGTLDVSGKTGSSVYALGNYAFVVSGNTLYSFNVTSKIGSHSPVSSVALAGNGKRVMVVESNVYVATDSTNSQLQIIPYNLNTGVLGNPTSINLNNNLAGVDAFVNSSASFAYVVTASSSGINNFYIVDLNNTNNKYGYATLGLSPKGITVVPRNRAIIVGTGNTKYEVFDTTIPSAASYCGGMSPTGVNSINAVASVAQPDGRVFSYILTDNSSAEFQIVLGGPGSGNFATSGTYTSAPIALANASNFNYFSADVSQPASTHIAIQVATANSVGGSCASAQYVYVGPDGTTGTYFTPVGNVISGQIPITSPTTPANYQNPGECFSYQVTITSSDQTLTPVLNDISINYSP